MDRQEFDRWLATLARRPTRRQTLRNLVGLGVIGVLGGSEVEARRKKKHHKKHRTGDVPVTSTCSDGLRNGTESDVDCGGSCGRCENGKTCSSFTDCQSGHCSSLGICQTCSGDGAGNCPLDGAGQCQCSPQGVCNSNSASIAPDCASCPVGTAACIFFDADLGANCYRRCGAV